MPRPDLVRGGIIHEGALYRGYRYSLSPDLARSYAEDHITMIKNYPRRNVNLPPRAVPAPGTPARSKFNFLVASDL